MNTANKHELFEHYCAAQPTFHRNPSFTDYAAGFDAGAAHMQSELDALKRQNISLRYGQKLTGDAENRITTLEALNKALIHSLSEINSDA